MIDGHTKTRILQESKQQQYKHPPSSNHPSKEERDFIMVIKSFYNVTQLNSSIR